MQTYDRDGSGRQPGRRPTGDRRYENEYREPRRPARPRDGYEYEDEYREPRRSSRPRDEYEYEDEYREPRRASRPRDEYEDEYREPRRTSRPRDEYENEYREPRRTARPRDEYEDRYNEPRRTSTRSAGAGSRYEGERREYSRTASRSGAGQTRSDQTRSSQSRSAAATKQRKSKQRNKIVLFVLEILIILVLIFVFWMVTRMTNNTEGPKYTVLEPEQLEIPEEVQENETMKGYMNIALFGVDAQTDAELLKGSRSDSTMIASINMDTGDIKLVSVYRDSYLNLEGKGDKANYYWKCNSAYSYGGAEQAIKMLNKNLDLDIENFVTVGYKGLREVIDGLGGIYLDIDSTELQHINNYQLNIAEKVLKCDYVPVTSTGYQLVDGLQAAAYCRIRYGGGDDFKRASRQREGIKALEEKAKKADLATLTKVFNNAIGDIYTSLSSQDILDLLAHIADFRIVEEGGFPEESMRTTANIGAKGSCVIPTDLESNVVWLHEFLFDEPDYAVTGNVIEYSRRIKEETQSYIK